MINISDRTIFCKDNLDVLQGINSESVDLIYLDPPFNKNKTFTAPIGSSAEGASFKDYFREEDVKDEWVETIKEDHIDLYNFLNGVKSISSSKHYLYNYCYLCYMAIRLIEMRRILKDTGSIYFHCDPTMSHYIKIMMDTIFGEDNLRNEVVWSYQGTGEPKNFFKRKHDILLFYSKGEDNFFDDDGSSEKISDFSKSKYTKTDDSGFFKEIRHSTGKIHKQYMRDKQRIRDVWDISIINSMAKERKGYPTQKPLKLLERIIKSSSKENDVVLDPFCGCATTCIASEKLNRNWIGIDISIKAYDLVRERLTEEVEGKFDFQGKNGNGIKVHFSTDSPHRTDRSGEDRLKKHVYVISNKSYVNEYKVGIAKNYKSRLNSYQIGDPNRSYKVEFTLLTEEYREIEKYIHRKFNNKHEWVTGNLKDIINEIENYKDKE